MIAHLESTYCFFTVSSTGERQICHHPSIDLPEAPRQLFHRIWQQHPNLMGDLKVQLIGQCSLILKMLPILIYAMRSRRYPHTHRKCQPMIILLSYLIIFPSGANWRCCRTLKNHQIWQKNEENSCYKLPSTHYYKYPKPRFWVPVSSLVCSCAAMHNCTGRGGPILVQKRANFFRDFEIETIWCCLSSYLYIILVILL